jgi:U32 family peptidase
VVAEAHKYNLEIFVNLNAWYYTDETMPFIEKMVEEISSIGADGIICGNIGILEYLKEKKYTGKINISTILALYNTEAIEFFLENYKVNKIILSRELTLKEIESLLLAFPKVKFEVFGEGDFCRYNNGLCFAEHKYSSRDICTIVVNDLVIKKRFRPDFKKIVLDEKLSPIEKIESFDERYEDKFYQVESIL